MSKKNTSHVPSAKGKEYTLYLGQAGTTSKGNPNLDAIAQDVARAILESGGSNFFEVRRVTDRSTPYMHIRSHGGFLNPGCVTMNALLEIAVQTRVSPDRINQSYLSIYSEHPYAQVPPPLRKALAAPPRELYERRRAPPSRRGRDAIPHVQQQQVGHPPEPLVLPGKRMRKVARRRDDEGVDTDAEQDDIMRRAKELYERELMGGGRKVRRRPDAGEDEDEDAGADADRGYLSDGQRVLPGLGRMSNRVVSNKKKGARYFEDPSLASIYGNVNAGLMGEPSDGEDGPPQQAGLEVNSEDDDESGGRSQLREVVCPRAFDPDFDLGYRKFVRNPRKVVLHSVSESDFITRDKKKLQKKLEQEVKNRSEQTRRLKEQMMRDKELHGDELERPIDERKLIKRSVDPMDLQKQMESQRRMWEQNQTRRIPRQYRDGTGHSFQTHALKRQYNESERVQKLDEGLLLQMQKHMGRERSRLNTRMWAPDSDDEPHELSDGDDFDGDGVAQDGGDDPTHEHGFYLTEDEGEGEGEEEEEEDDLGRRRRSSSSRGRGRGKGRAGSRTSSASTRKVQISQALYSGSQGARGAYDDEDDATSGEEGAEMGEDSDFD